VNENENEMDYQVTIDRLSEFAIVIKAICNEYSLSQEELCKFGDITDLETKYADKMIRLVRQVPLKIPINRAFAPRSERERTDRTSHTEPTQLDLTRPDITWNQTRRVGLCELEVESRGRWIRFWRLRSFAASGLFGIYYSYFVEHNNLPDFERVCSQFRKHTVHVDPPILKKGMLEDIWGNTIGFLKDAESNKGKYKEFNIPCKRGILLSGRPGNGKTLTCKYLRQACNELGFEHRVVTMEGYRRAHGDGHVRRLFQLSARGIIFFDDMDIMFEDREKGNTHLTEFLTNLDGIDPNEGVVFVFTSNKTEGLDGAFIRPGRVDLIMIFDVPNNVLRRRFIKDRFHLSLLEGIDIEDLVNRMEVSESESNKDFPYSYAEIEEIRKLLSMDYIGSGEINVDATFKLFEKHRQEFNDRITHFGFGKKMDVNDF